MRALKTIVATAVIVFALTTVAVAGVQRLTGQTGAEAGGDRTAAAAAQPAHRQASPGAVTLSARQFAALLRAVDDGDAGDRERDRSRANDKDRRHTQERARTHAATSTGGSSASGSKHTGAHDGTTTHSPEQTSTHSGGGHSGGNHGGGHSGGHDAGDGGHD